MEKIKCPFCGLEAEHEILRSSEVPGVGIGLFTCSGCKKHFFAVALVMTYQPANFIPLMDEMIKNIGKGVL